ncbi:MAG: ACP S-malonyltransferase [Holophagales bacterium]|nr:MAG: ACP S-malonyltransferase [Holophagales bacterium]
MKVAALFAGQQSERVGMGRALAERSPAARQLLDRASRVLGRDLGRLLFEGPAHELNRPVNSQLAVLTVDLMAWEAVRESRRQVDLVTGFSLGALAALVAASGLELEGALAIVVRTAEIYDEILGALAAGMAAIVGVPAERIERACVRQSRGGELATIASRSHPSTVVVTGDHAAVARVVEEIAPEALRTSWLPVGWPVHSPLLEPVVARLHREIEQLAPCRDLAIPVVSPFDGAVIRDRAEVRRLSGRVVVEPLRWDLALERCAALGVTKFYECGAGEQIGRMLRWWRRDVALETIGAEIGPLAEAV